MKRLLVTLFNITLCFVCFAQGPNNSGTYYHAANGKKFKELKTALHNIIKKANVLSYGSGEGHTWDGFYTSDRNSDNSVIDRYSDEKRYFSEKGSAIGGMNIEHSMPKSWWGGSQNQAYKDIQHLMPSDANANSAKSNFCMGEVVNLTKIVGNIKIGKGQGRTTSSLTLWEPADKWKGDFARIYFYMATCYSDLNWVKTNPCSEQVDAANTDWPFFYEYVYKMLLEWAENDPVDDIEIQRNNAVYTIQGNRNPFIDYPKLEQYIWGNLREKAFSYDHYEGADPVNTPEVPYALSATCITSTGFTANWEYADNSESYTLELTQSDLEKTEDMVLLDEDFNEFKTASSISVEGSLDKYMKVKGWTGSKIYPDVGRVKLASGSSGSELTSPLLQNPNGHVIVTFDEQVYGNDATTVRVSVLDANGRELQNKNVTAQKNVTSELLTFNDVDCDYKISFTSTKGSRYYLDNVKVVAGSGGATVTTMITGIETLEHTFSNLSNKCKYSYRVKGVNKDAESDWSNSIDVELKASCLLGDANNDGVVNVNDITCTADYILTGNTVSFNHDNADVNKDGIINVNDITSTAAIILGSS